MDTRLSVEVAGLRFRNPFLLAAGILGITAGLLVRVESAGAGGVVTKTITRNPREGHENPVVYELECGLLNSMGLPNPGIDYFVDEIARAKELLSVPLIVSVGGSTPEEVAYVVRRAVEAGADGVELNASCPHVERYGVELLQDLELFEEVVERAKDSARTKPLFVKLSATGDLIRVAETAIEAGADCLVAINTIRAMAVDVWAQRPVLGGIYGGLSGPAIRPIAVRCVYELYEEFPDVPIVGVGGICKWEDVAEMLLAGAVAVQIGTAVAYRGLSIFEELALGISEYLDELGLSSVRELVGRAHRG